MAFLFIFHRTFFDIFFQGTAPSQFVFSSKTTQQSPLNLTPQLEFGFKPIISSTSTSKPAAAVPFTFSSVTNTRTENAGKFKSSSAFSAPGASSRFKFSSFDHIIDETDTLVAPRLPRQPGFSNGQTHNNKFQFQNNEINIDHHDAFFFTTTPKPTTLGGAQTGNSHSSGGGGSGSGSGSSSLNEIHKIKPGIFDMRKFFFIPQKTKKLHVNNNNLGGPGGHQLQGPGQAERRVHHLHQHHFHHVPHRGFHFRGRRSSLAEIMRWWEKFFREKKNWFHVNSMEKVGTDTFFSNMTMSWKKFFFWKKSWRIRDTILLLWKLPSYFFDNIDFWYEEEKKSFFILLYFLYYFLLLFM